ncbi:hypothetical protein JCM10207_006028 [Rhodosporidiobolus poonsookiae]
MCSACGMLSAASSCALRMQAVMEHSVQLADGPLLPLLPPKPSSGSLPPLAPRPSTSPHLPGWTRDAFVVPAAFPRSYRGSTKRPGQPRAPMPPPGPSGRVDPKKAFETLVKPQVEGFGQAVRIDKPDELEEQEQLQIVVNRYRPERPRRQGEEPGLTLVFSHANGFYKEVWEPTLSALVAQLDGNDRSLPVEEIWAIDCINQGESAVLNQDVLGDVFNWADHGRDLINFIISYLDSPSLSTATPPASLTPASLAPASNVPATLLALDNTPFTSPGPSTPVKRTYRNRLIVGVGHSLGGGATAYAASALPSVFSSVIFVDPVLVPPDTTSRSMEALTTGALLRKEQWKTREEAKAGFLKKPFFQAWDKSVLEGYVQHGLKEIEGGVALTCTARDEAITFCDPMAIAARRACARLSLLPTSLPVHFVFADESRSVLSEDMIKYILVKAVPHATSSRVKGAGHLVVHEKPAETAKLIAAFLEKTYSKEARVERAKL